MSIGFLGGYLSQESGPIGGGVIIGSDSEFFAAETDDKVSVPFDGANVAFPVGPGTYTFYGRYGSGSDSVASSIESGGSTDVGIVHTDFAPSGDTGIFLGNSGLDTRIDRKVKVFSIGGAFSFPIQNLEGDGNSLNGRVGVEYQRTQQRANISIQSPSFGSDITSMTWQRVNDNNFTVFLGGEYASRPDRGFQFAVGGDVMVIFHDAKLRSQQDVVCIPCGSSNESFSIEVVDSDKSTEFGARASAYLGYGLGNGLAIGAKAFVDHRGNGSQIINPRTGDDLFIDNQPTQIGSRNQTNFGAAIVFSVQIP